MYIYTASLFLRATSSSTNHLCISNVPRTIHMWIYCTILAMKSQDYRKRYEMDTRVCTVSSAKLSRVLFRSTFDTQELQQPVSLHILCCKPSRKVATSSNRYYLVGLRNLISNITAAVQLHKLSLGASFALFPHGNFFIGNLYDEMSTMGSETDVRSEKHTTISSANCKLGDKLQPHFTDDPSS